MAHNGLPTTNTKPETAPGGTPLSFAWRGGWWVVGQSLLMIGIVLGGVWGPGRWGSTLTFAAGWVLFTLGGIVGVLGVKHLGPARTAFPRPLAGSQLVTTGIYQWIRHPLYCSVLTAALGWGLIWVSCLALTFTLALALFLNEKAKREERWLTQAFPEYAEYAKKVKRLVPGLY